jgi:hypothetical protein
VKSDQRNFQVGDKVVCVDDSPPKNTCDCQVGKNQLRKGAVYVVRGTVNIGGGGIYLVGIWSITCRDYSIEHPFISSRFRLLSDLRAESLLNRTVQRYIEERDK